MIFKYTLALACVAFFACISLEPRNGVQAMFLLPEDQFLENWLQQASSLMFDFRNFKLLQEKQKEILDLARNFQTISSADTASVDEEKKHFDYGCNCSNYVCKCCTFLKVNKFNDTGELSI